MRQSVRLNEQANTWSTTTHYFDRRGNEYAAIDALGYVTLMDHDAVGNLTRQSESARAATSWNLDGWSVVVPQADDRVIDYAYDLGNRKTSETRRGVETDDGARHDVTTGYGYDALGNLTRTTDAANGDTYSYYDALGRVLAVAAPRRQSVVDGSELIPLTTFQRDAYGNVVVQIDHAQGAQIAVVDESGQPIGAATDETHYTAGPASADDRSTLTRYDLAGHALDVMNANRNVRHTSYDALGHAAKRWQGVTGNDGVQRTTFQVTSYDKLVHVVGTVDPGPRAVRWPVWLREWPGSPPNSRRTSTARSPAGPAATTSTSRGLR